MLVHTCCKNLRYSRLFTAVNFIPGLSVLSSLVFLKLASDASKKETLTSGLVHELLGVGDFVPAGAAGAHPAAGVAA